MNRPALVLALSLVLSWSSAAVAQSPSDVYDRVAPSVFVMEVRESGEVKGQATAFKIGPSRLLTNAHAVRGEQVWLRVGPVTVQAKVIRTDEINDLALLELDAELAAPSLEFSTTEMKPGIRVFAIGNPRGLERTISEGLITGPRTVDGRTVLQISAPISPGSSGGPVVSEAGLVIGVAVGAYTTGQNLNFAVPARIALNFIEGGSDKTVDIVTVLGLAKRLSDERAGVEYSADGASAYQRLNRELNASLNQAVDLASSHAQLLDIWQMAGLGSAEEERAARKGVTLAPTSATALELLARTLNGQTIVAESPEAKAALRTEAEKYALMAVANATASERAAPLFTLARIQFGADRAADAYKTYLQIKAPSGTEQARDALLGLFATSRALGRRAEAKRWFDQAAQMKLSIAASQWEDLAEMLEQEPSLGDAAAAYVQAATGATYLYRHYCSAARIYASVNRTDEALGAARQCLDRATKAQDGDSNAQFAHRILSVLLRGRGVIDQAIGHARDAIGIDATDGYAHAALGQALYEAQRYTEAETILRTAIRLTDGGEDFIHFALGLVLFKQEKWSEAQRSFERAAELDPRDDGAAYNVAISLARQSFFRDAAKWYEEALRRNPARSDATELRDRIRELRR